MATHQRPPPELPAKTGPACVPDPEKSWEQKYVYHPEKEADTHQILAAETGPACVPDKENKLGALRTTKLGPAHKNLERVPDAKKKFGTMSHATGGPARKR